MTDSNGCLRLASSSSLPEQLHARQCDHTAKPYEPSAYKPSETALIFIDCHSAVLSNLADYNPLIQEAKKLLATAHKNNIAILHCLTNVNSEPAQTNKLVDTQNATKKRHFSKNPKLAPDYDALALYDWNSTSCETVYKRDLGRLSVLDDGVLKYIPG